MDSDKIARAVFGTTLSATVAGSGQVILDPPGGVYPYGTVLRLTAVPQSGSYFGFWGNAATGNTNPLYFTISSPNPVVSSIFTANSANQVALTVLVNGHGRVTANPRANSFSTSPVSGFVTLTAVPDAGQSFLNWSGDASGTQNQLSISMNQNRVINANFTSRPGLRVDRPGLEGFTPEGFRLTLVSDPMSHYEIMSSTNLSTWTSLGVVTNTSGEVQITDPAAAQSRAGFYKAILAP
ncbi:MAG: exported protein of unknown function [Pedosphaera sp.]|nr:exported protein of unknown function [Pedosphaera sp.]